MRRLGPVAGAAIVLGVLVWLMLDHRRSGGRAADSPAVAPAPAPGGHPTPAAPLPQAGPVEKQPTAGKFRTFASWGSAPGQLGHKLDPEGAPEGPMSLASGRAGDLWVVDQVNGRIQHFDAHGKALEEIHVSTTTQDLVIGPNGNLYALDRLGRSDVTVFDRGGPLIDSDAVVGGTIGEGGAVTGIFADADGVYLEREHGETVRIAGADGRFDAERKVAPGRPSRDGSAFVKAARAGRRSPLVTVSVFGRDATPRWQRTLLFARTVMNLVLLDTDLGGHLFVAALVADEATAAPFALEGLAIEVLRVGLADGADGGALILRAPQGPEESFRELAITDDGEVLQMLPQPDGMRIESYRFP